MDFGRPIHLTGMILYLFTPVVNENEANSVAAMAERGAVPGVIQQADRGTSSAGMAGTRKG